MSERALKDRPLPSLAQWIGDGSRAEEFEDWLRDMLAAEQHAVNPQEAQVARLLKTLAIACVEGLRIEQEIGADVIRASLMLARLCGVAAMSATICTLRDGSPLLRIAKVLTEEFGHGARQAARSNMQDAVAPGEAGRG